MKAGESCVEKVKQCQTVEKPLKTTLKSLNFVLRMVEHNLKVSKGEVSKYRRNLNREEIVEDRKWTKFDIGYQQQEHRKKKSYSLLGEKEVKGELKTTDVIIRKRDVCRSVWKRK